MAKAKYASFFVAGCLMVGFGFGFGLAVSGKPFLIEASDTPVGSFVLRGNIDDSYSLPYPSDVLDIHPSDDEIA